MKIKNILSAFLVCSLVFTMIACSGKDTEKKPVFRRSTMKVPTFQIISHTFFWFRFPKKLDFPRKFDALPGAFFIEKIFIMLYNNSTT